MYIFGLGNGVKYIDDTAGINFTTAKGNITPIKISDTVVAFKNNVAPQKSFDVSNILDANGDEYGADADAVILALSSLVFKTEGGGIPITPDLKNIKLVDGAVIQDYYVESEDYTLLCDSSETGEINILLPFSNVSEGRILVIKKIDSVETNSINIIPQSGIIEFAVQYSFNKQGYGVMIQCDGTDWFVLSNNYVP